MIILINKKSFNDIISTKYRTEFDIAYESWCGVNLHRSRIYTNLKQTKYGNSNHFVISTDIG